MTIVINRDSRATMHHTHFKLEAVMALIIHVSSVHLKFLFYVLVLCHDDSLLKYLDLNIDDISPELSVSFVTSLTTMIPFRIKHTL